MATKIRLARGGSKKRPFYRIVVADERAPRDGNFIEKIGNFNPMVPKDHKERVMLSKERAEHWLKVGALPTERVQKILSELGMMEAPKITEKTKKHLPKAKAQERVKAKEEAASKAAEDAKATEEAAKAEDEKPTEEVITRLLSRRKRKKKLLQKKSPKRKRVQLRFQRINPKLKSNYL